MLTCWVPEFLFCYERENMATLPLQHAERRPELSLAGHFASAFCPQVLLALASSHTRVEVLQGRNHAITWAGHVTFAHHLGSQLTLSNNDTIMAFFFFTPFGYYRQ